MLLGGLIAFLEKQHPTRLVFNGFASPHSYRGFYEDLAFAPKENCTFGEMLACAKEAMGVIYTGWGGDDFTTGEFTRVWLAKRGSTGRGITGSLLQSMVNEGRPISEVVELEKEKLKALATDMHAWINDLGDHIEAFNKAGGKVNLRVHHNDGSESLDLHDLSGEFEITFFRVDEIEP